MDGRMKDPNIFSSAWGGENLRILTAEERQAGLKNISLSDEAFTLTGRPIMSTEGVDIHKQTAAEVYGIPEDQVTPEQRIAAREINFGITYGSNREGMTHKALRAESQIAGFRAMYGGGGYSSMAAVKATYEAYKRFIATENDPDDLVQLERRLLARQWMWEETQRQRLRMPSPVVLAALAGFAEGV